MTLRCSPYVAARGRGSVRGGGRPLGLALDVCRPGAAEVSGVKAGPQGRRRRRCAAALRPEGRPRTLPGTPPGSERRRQPPPPGPGPGSGRTRLSRTSASAHNCDPPPWPDQPGRVKFSRITTARAISRVCVRDSDTLVAPNRSATDCATPLKRSEGLPERSFTTSKSRQVTP